MFATFQGYLFTLNMVVKKFYTPLGFAIISLHFHRKTNKIYQCTLVQNLKEFVLSVRYKLLPINRRAKKSQ